MSIPLPSVDDVAAGVEELEPVTASDLVGHLMREGRCTWSQRGTIRNRLLYLVTTGRIIQDDGRPMRYAVNHLR